MCKYQYECSEFLFGDCCGEDCYGDGYTHEDYRRDHDFDDPDFIGQVVLTKTT